MEGNGEYDVACSRLISRFFRIPPKIRIVWLIKSELHFTKTISCRTIQPINLKYINALLRDRFYAFFRIIVLNIVLSIEDIVGPHAVDGATDTENLISVKHNLRHDLRNVSSLRTFSDKDCCRIFEMSEILIIFAFFALAFFTMDLSWLEKKNYSFTLHR